jgi:DNA repair exonuclease SbcCD ATPase subunit
MPKPKDESTEALAAKVRGAFTRIVDAPDGHPAIVVGRVNEKEADEALNTLLARLKAVTRQRNEYRSAHAALEDRLAEAEQVGNLTEEARQDARRRQRAAEKERDGLRESEAKWQRRGDRALRAEAERDRLVLELVEGMVPDEVDSWLAEWRGRSD